MTASPTLWQRTRTDILAIAIAATVLTGLHFAAKWLGFDFEQFAIGWLAFLAFKAHLQLEWNQP